MSDHLLSLTTFAPTAFALLMLLVPSANRKLYKSIALIGACAAFFFASWLAYDYGWNEEAHLTLAQTYEQRIAEGLAELKADEPDRHATVAAALGFARDLARRDLPANRRAALEAELAPKEDELRKDAAFWNGDYARLKDMTLAVTVPQSKHLRFVEDYPWIASFKIRYLLAADGLSIPLIWLTALLTILCLVYSWNVEKLDRAYFALFLLLETGLIGVFCALDFFLFYVFWEIVLLPMYFLIGIWGGPRRIYAAIKFFIYTIVGSVLMLVAMLAIYFQAEPHSFNVVSLMAVVPFLAQSFQWWIFVALFIAFAIKVPVFPFHTWLPDAHVEAPTAASMVLAGILLKMGGYGFFRFSYPLTPDLATSEGFVYFIAILGMINIVYGALVAMAQNDFKSLVAYSSISHMGFVLLGLAALTPGGYMGGVWQMVNHGISSPMMFCLVGVIYDRAHHRNLNDFGGIGLQMPWYTGLAVLGFFAALGLPGLNGFIGEVLTFLGAYQAESLLTKFGARWIVYVSLTGIVLTAAYILWTIQRVYLGPIKEKYLAFRDLDGREALSLVPLAALCVLFGVYPALLIDYMDPSIQAILDAVKPAAGAAATAATGAAVGS